MNISNILILVKEVYSMHEDSVKLLRECNSGIKMGIHSIDEVINSVKDHKLSDILMDSKKAHEKLEDATSILIEEYNDGEKEPGVMAKTMAWVKTNMKLAMNETDKTIAGLITDGCNMGVKSVHRYLNEYAKADEKVKDIARRLINEEEELVTRIKGYL